MGNADGFVAVVQARVGSSRLPRKVLAPIAGTTVLGLLLERCRASKRLRDVVVATTLGAADDEVAALAERAGARAFRGSEDDVLDRYVGAAEAAGAEVVVRLCADSPLADAANIDEAIALFEEGEGADYAYVDGYPLGLGNAEVVRASALRRAHAATGPGETRFREHVTTYVKAHPEAFRVRLARPAPALDRPELRLTIDEPADLDLARRVADYFAPRRDFRASEVIALLDARPELVAINAHVRQRQA